MLHSEAGKSPAYRTLALVEVASGSPDLEANGLRVDFIQFPFKAFFNYSEGEPGLRKPA